MAVLFTQLAVSRSLYCLELFVKYGRHKSKVAGVLVSKISLADVLQNGNPGERPCEETSMKIPFAYDVYSYALMGDQ